MKEYFQQFYKKCKPLIDKVFNEKSAKIFRITYSVTWNLILIFLICLVLGLSLGAGIGAGYFASLVKDEYPRSYEELKKDINNYEAQSELYFDNNVFLGYLRSDIIREEVDIENVSDYVINAVIATEDQNFYEHNGVVPKAVFRALFQEVTNSSVQTGGSTLTQQLVKNQILTNEVSFERKAKEILLALRLEKFFDKDEILEAYLNVSTFGRNSSGRNIAGVQAAAQGIFGVDAKDLTLPQAAFIAGLPQSPFGYTPYTNKGELKSEEGLQPGLERQKIVLARMLEMGFITQQEYDEAIQYNIVQDFIPAEDSVMDDYAYLTMESERRAIDILMEIQYKKDGYTKEDIENSEVLEARYEELATRNLRQNGYKIYTTINKDIYDKWQQVTAEFAEKVPYQTVEETDPETNETIQVQEPLEVGAMLIDNDTGKIISFVGGLDYERENSNHATQTYRSNGSTMKPLVVYGPAIDMGLASPGSVMADVDLGYVGDDGNPWPTNFTPKYYGLTSARTALAKSYNVSAVFLYSKIISHNPVQYLEKMGIERLEPSDYENLSMALGGIKNGVSVEENTNAYATFANDGQFVDAYLIEKIEDKDGNVIYQHESEPVEVFSPQAAYLTTDMMRDVVQSGTASSIPGRLHFSTDLAGKTGTSTDTKDKWFVGYNPNVTLGVWIGFDQPKKIPSYFENEQLTIWANLMNATYDTNPDVVGASDRFDMPGGIVQRTYCGVSGLLPSNTCSQAGLTLTDYFIEEYAPTKVDDSLLASKYVTIDGKNYVALDSTPSEFTKFGVMLNPDFVKELVPNIKNVNQLIPDTTRWSNILIPDAKIGENGKVPSPVTISLSGYTISWNKHSENDVIGYRVYQVVNGQRGVEIGSIMAGSSLAYNLPGNGQYAVAAVDISGNESALSNIISIGTTQVTPADSSSNSTGETDESNE